MCNYVLGENKKHRECTSLFVSITKNVEKPPKQTTKIFLLIFSSVFVMNAIFVVLFKSGLSFVINPTEQNINHWKTKNQRQAD